jgi:hypothetical protein
MRPSRITLTNTDKARIWAIVGPLCESIKGLGGDIPLSPNYSPELNKAILEACQALRLGIQAGTNPDRSELESIKDQ